MPNVIRKISVARAIAMEQNDGSIIEKSLNLIVGVEHNIYIDGRRVKRKICSIEETKKHLFVYLENESESQLWQKLPKNDQTKIEYTID